MKSKFMKSLGVILSATIVFSSMPFNVYATEEDASVIESLEVDKNNTEQTEPTTSVEEIVKVPEITRFQNTAEGTKISWTEYEGAEKYRLFMRDGSEWKRVGVSKTLSYTHSSLKNGTTYTYTIRAMDDDNNYISGYFKQGYENTFYAPPEISSLTSTNNGVSIKWKKQSGVDGYRVYRRTKGSKWINIADVTGSSYVDKNVTSGVSYTYTIRYLDVEGNLISYHNSGKSIKYVESPSITKIENTATGAKISWTKSEGAAKYRVYYRDSNNDWKKIGNTTSTSFTHENLKTGTTYTYTVRCLDSKNNFVSSFDKTGVSNMFITTPQITSLTNVYGGVQVKWGKLSGAESYRVYRKTSSSKWTKIDEADSTTYVDKNVTAGTKYTYTIRCLDSNGKLISYHNKGMSITYVEAPAITKIENTATGSKISWTKSAGASKYRVYYLDSNDDWKKIGNTTSTSFTHEKLKAGTTYTYTVRCLDSKDNFVSGYDKSGKSNLFLAPPSISSVSKTNNGNLIKWADVEGVAGYRLYRKTIGASWKKLADITDTSYIDTSVKSGTVYTYTLRCLDENNKLISYYISDTKYYVDGKLANGKIAVGNNIFYFDNGLFRSGLQTINGNKYYYNSSGVLQKNGIVGSKKDGWYYADKNGKIDFTYSNGVKQDGIEWIVMNGKATKVTNESDRTLYRALKVVAKITDNSMTKSQKLRVCFDYVKVAYVELNPRIPHYTGNDWPILYANDMFVDGAGNCLSYGAAFAYMAKAIGYEEVYCCHSGGHGWAEIDGLVYDPEWSKHHFVYDYYALSYDTKTDQNYKGAIAPGYSWMHVKI